MKQLIRAAVNHPVTVSMAVLTVFLLGYISFGRLGMDLFPDMNNPRLYVELAAGERPPEEIETRFVESIESQAIRQKNAVRVSSVSRVGSAVITVEYSWDANMDEAFLDLQKTLNDFASLDELDELEVSQIDPNASPVVVLALSHPTISDMNELRQIAESFIRTELVRLEGVADVQLLGEEEREVTIETDPYRMEAYALTPSALANRISSYNRNVSGGSIVEMGTKYIIKGISEFSSLADIGNVIVANTTVRTSSAVSGEAATETTPVFLRDVATIQFRNKEPDTIVRINGTRCMGLTIYKETRYNTITAVDELMTALDTIKKALPSYDLTVISNQGTFISSAVGEVEQSALIGILLAVLILFVFLRRIGTTLVVSLAIPVSVMATFNFMYFSGLTLNIMTLGGLALGAGMLVDNAIVVMESIIRTLESGASLKDAVIEGSSEVSGAITASTITTIVVFLPIVYMQGASGELFKDQALTVAFALVSSLLVAYFIIPLFSYRLMGRTVETASALRSIRFGWYGNVLETILRFKWFVIAVAVAVVAGSYSLLPRVGSEFLPKTDVAEFKIECILPAGTELNRTSQTVAGIEYAVGQALGDEVKSVFTVVGSTQELGNSGSSLYSDDNTAVITIRLREDHTLTSDDVLVRLDNVLKDVSGVETRVIQEQTALQLTMGDESAPISVDIAGEDLDILRQLTEQARDRLAELPDLFNIETSFDEGRPEIDIRLDRVRAGILNISIDTVASSLQSVLTGTTAGEWEDRGEMTDLTINLPRVSVGALGALTVPGPARDVRIDEIADLARTVSPGEINRDNQTRIGRINAYIKSDSPLDKTVTEIESVMSGISFPQNYRYRIGGEERERREAFTSLAFALLLSLLLVYMVMASQFESLVHPFTILFSIPMAFSGAVLIFFIAGKPFNIMAYIGIIMLGGIAVNGSIVLVDAINRLKRSGFSRREAIIEAGKRRIRPIVMTGLTTILAMIPLTLGFGEGASLRAPLALAVIGGLVTSTILTLIVIPCVYEIIDAVFHRD